MNKHPTLLILAAGMASRYGSLKQLDKFGPTGETIIDYSIHDAMKAGFGKVVFVIRESIEEEFKRIMLKKFEDRIHTEYVLQELDRLPEGFSVPENREKPWGTGHAVWIAASKIHEPFAVINGDDFYGYQSFKIMADFLKNPQNESQHCLVGFQLEKTLSDHGAVSRGICQIGEANKLESVTEQTHIIRTAKGIIAQDAEKGEILLNGKETVSMNLTGFTPAVFPYFETYFKDFLINKSPKSLKAEFFLPEVVNKLIQTGKGSFRVLPTPEKWFGVTFPDDKATAIKCIEELVASGLYPQDLWNTPITR
jgi:NDP-sugar pyrophosphorylase family protein